MRRFTASLAGLTLLAGLLGHWEPARGNDLGMRRIPRAEIEIGSSYAELLDTAEWCNQLSHSSECRAEDFVVELSLGHQQTIPGFLIDVFETSIADYDRCVSAGRCEPDGMEEISAGITRDETRPVTMVSQRDAAAYCSFRSARLPTEEEFELAARGRSRRRFPWGEFFHAGRVNGGSLPPKLTEEADGHEMLAPVRAFGDGRTPEGIFQLAGNAAEWTSSRVRGPDGKPGQKYIVRGGHFASAPWHLRAAHREALLPQTRRLTVGFRCAKSDGTPRP